MRKHQKPKKRAKTNQGKRQSLNNELTRELMTMLEVNLKSTVELPRIKVGKKQSIGTLINEEALLFAKYVRNEKGNWNPRNCSVPPLE